MHSIFSRFQGVRRKKMENFGLCSSAGSVFLQGNPGSASESMNEWNSSLQSDERQMIAVFWAGGSGKRNWHQVSFQVGSKICCGFISFNQFTCQTAQPSQSRNLTLLSLSMQEYENKFVPSQYLRNTVSQIVSRNMQVISIRRFIAGTIL